MAALSSLSVSKTLSVVLVRPWLIPLPPAQLTGALSVELTRRQFCKVMRVKDTPKKWKWPDYSGTLLYGHLYITDSFVCSDKKIHKFSLILTRLIRTLACPVGVRINGVPLVLKAERLVSYKNISRLHYTYANIGISRRESCCDLVSLIWSCMKKKSTFSENLYCSMSCPQSMAKD